MGEHTQEKASERKSFYFKDLFTSLRREGTSPIFLREGRVAQSKERGAIS